jgi:hypothetical protein
MTARLLLLAAIMISCRSPATTRATRMDTAKVPPLPTIPVYEIASRDDTLPRRFAPSRTRDPLGHITSTRRVTITTSSQDVRTLLLWLAEQAGASLVISPEVNARVTVSFHDVPVVEAMRAVLAEAGLSVLVGPLEAPWPPVVFHQMPVNIETATAETIAARFGVSLELARFIVESRPKP